MNRRSFLRIIPGAIGVGIAGLALPQLAKPDRVVFGVKTEPRHVGPKFVDIFKKQPGYRYWWLTSEEISSGEYQHLKLVRVTKSFPEYKGACGKEYVENGYYSLLRSVSDR